MLEPVTARPTKAKKESKREIRKANLEVCHLNSHDTVTPSPASDNY